MDFEREIITNEYNQDLVSSDNAKSQMLTNLSAKVDLFLDNRNYDTYLQIIHSGYIPTQQQQHKFNQIINYFIKNKEYVKIYDILQKGYIFNINNIKYFIDTHFLLDGVQYIIIDKDNSSFKNKRSLIDYFFNTKTLIKAYNIENKIENGKSIFDDIKKGFSNIKTKAKNAIDFLSIEKNKEEKLIIQNHILDLYGQNHIQNLLYSSFNNELAQSTKWFFPDYKAIKNAVLLYSFITPEHMKSKGLEHYLEMINNLKKLHTKLQSKDDSFSKILDKFILNLQENIPVLFPSLAADSITETKLLYIKENAQQVVKEQIAQAYDSTTIKSFPKRIADEINNIQSQYAKIIASNPNSVITKEIEKIISVQLPDIIKNYITMQPEYRLEMKNNQGKNAEDLLYESLQNIGGILIKRLKDAQTDNLSSLSVKNRLIKSKNS